MHRERPPIRIMTRLLAEMQTAILAAGLQALQGELDRFLIFTLVVRQSLSPESSPISAHSLAGSLGRPYETMRRHLNALVESGLCTRTPLGVLADRANLSKPPYAAVLATAHDSFIRLVEDLKALGVAVPSSRRDAAYTPAAGIQAAADFALATTETNRGTHRDWTELVLFSTTLCANTSGFARDPELAARHRDETNPVPPELIRPIRPGALARAIGVAETTVRRRTHAMVADGRLERVQGGLRVSESWFARPEAVEASIATFQHMKRILDRAAAAGLPFDAPASVYIRGRPADIAFS